MRKKIMLSVAVLIVVFTISSGFKIYKQTGQSNQNKAKKNFHDFTVETIDGKQFALSKLKGKKVLVVNVASQCGLTPQYKILQEIYETMDTSKFEIIGFPANNFLQQEPGTNDEIKTFCTKNYGLTFPLMAKVSVCEYIYKSYPIDSKNATKTTTDEIYKWLTQKSENGVLDTQIQWNFQKFLIDENGNLIGSLSPSISTEILTLKSWFAEN
ncbi:MAG: glutathione peroxidase [Bacteroidetes bacterium]|jgi:glutathione peroxidase|nr:glutathione peroxidase [Bacteroidota bacterium]MBT6684691.1 glutathione peroxidase [Bacteroidota bacterium]MBT7143127.1 glutathione peroxidase [Bacteroidota bacterium]MBT7492527.1 glutathione peroxidase [Bacteroidota bacterium]